MSYLNHSRPSNRRAAMERCLHEWPNDQVKSEPDHPVHRCKRPQGHVARSSNPGRDYHSCACGSSGKRKGKRKGE